MNSPEEAKDAIEVLSCTYLPSHPIYGPQIRIKGLNQQMITNVIREIRPLALTHSYSPETKQGHASFAVDDERDARKLIETLNEKLKPYNASIEDIM